jgi:hypothetical protein
MFIGYKKITDNIILSEGWVFLGLTFTPRLRATK